jgi:hypothetical protein
LVPSEDIDDTPAGTSLEIPAVRRGRAKKSSPKKRLAKGTPAGQPPAKKNSLLAITRAAPLDESDDDESSGEARPGSERPDTLDIPAASSSAVTPELPLTPGLPVEVQSGDDREVTYPKFGRRIYQGQSYSPNNRAVAGMHFDFEEHEIGFRNIYDEIEKGVGPNPKDRKVRHDRVGLFNSGGGGYALLEHKPGDFDPVLIKRYKLNPQSGLPVPGTCNPDNVVPRTDFTKPVPRTRPIIFVSKDGMKTIETSRSSQYVHAEQDWEKLEKLMDLKAELGKYDIREIITPNGFATYDSVAREVSEHHATVSSLLQAAEQLEDPRQPSFTVPQKPQKSSSNSASGDIRGPPLLTATQTPLGYDEVQEIGREAFMKTARPAFARTGELEVARAGGLEALADAAEYAGLQAARRSPAAAKYVQSNSIQTGYSSTTYPPPKQQNNFQQSASQNSRSAASPLQSSPRTIVPQSNEFKSGSTKAALSQFRVHQSGGYQPLTPQPRTTASQSSASRVMGSLSSEKQSTPQPATVPQSNRPQKISPQPIFPPASTGRQSSVAQPKTPQSITPPAVAAQTKAPPAITTQSVGQSAMVPQSANSQTTTPRSMGPPSMAPSPLAPSPLPPQSMGPPKIGPQMTPSKPQAPQSVMSQQIAPQLISPRTMGPPATPAQKMASPTMATQKQGQQAMGPPPVLLQPSSSSFTRPRSTSGPGMQSQSMLPPRAPTQASSPPIYNTPQQLSQAQQYFHGARQQVQQQQQLQQQQQQVQQHQQQQPSLAQAARASRSASSNSGLRDILPRPNQTHEPPQHASRGQRRYYDNAAATIPPFQGPGGATHSTQRYGYAAPPPQSQPQSQQFQSPPQHKPGQPQSLQFQNTTQQQQGQLQQQGFQRQAQLPQLQSHPQHFQSAGQRLTQQANQTPPLQRHTARQTNQQQTTPQQLAPLRPGQQQTPPQQPAPQHQAQQSAAQQRPTTQSQGQQQAPQQQQNQQSQPQESSGSTQGNQKTPQQPPQPGSRRSSGYGYGYPDL